MWASESNAKIPVPSSSPAVSWAGHVMQVAVCRTDYAQVSHARHGRDVHANAGVAMHARHGYVIDHHAIAVDAYMTCIREPRSSVSASGHAEFQVKQEGRNFAWTRAAFGGRVTIHEASWRR